MEEQQQQQPTEATLEDKAVGCLLTVLIGDALGATTEGWPADEVAAHYPRGMRRYEAGLHMGVRRLGVRRAMYTDDGQSTLALAASLAEQGRLDARHAARSYAAFFRHKPQRGYPPTAQQVLLAVERGADIRDTGRSAIKEGSWANGAAMRIAPIGVAFRGLASDGSEDYATLREAVRLAVLSSHVHPLAVDGAFVVALAVALLLRPGVAPATFDAGAFLARLADAAAEPDMRRRLAHVVAHRADLPGDGAAVAPDAWEARMAAECKMAREVSDSEFQIRADEAVATALLAFALHWRAPADALAAVVAYGGDTDTTAAILGGVLGALHGRAWIPAHLFDDLENGPYGRDYAIALAKKLAALDLRSVEGAL